MKRHILFASVLLASTSAFAQSGNVSGVVVDKMGNPVSGALVEIQNNKFIKAYTDKNGAFEIGASANDELVIDAPDQSKKTVALNGSKEIKVVMEERRLRTDDNPMSKAFERFKAMAYPASGYHTPTIGWMADLERMTVEELRAWYQAWYAPNNATLVVVGDVTKDEVRGLAEQYFGAIPRRDVPPAKLPRELAEPGVYVAVMNAPGNFSGDYQTTYFYVSDIGLHLHRNGSRIDAFATSLKSGRALDGVEFELLDGDGKRVGALKGDGDGRAAAAVNRSRTARSAK